MSQYTAVAVIGLGITFIITWIAFKLNEKHDAARLGLLLGSSVMLMALGNVATHIADTLSTTHALNASVDYIYFITIAIGSMLMLYFILYFLFATMRRAIDKKEGKGDWVE